MADVATVAELFKDKYEVVEKLEWNGLSLVYRAQRANGESLAVAMLPIDTESSPEAAAMFKSKATELQLLVEPGIVRVTGHGVQHGVPYLELEYVDATTLAEELLDGPLERDQAFSLTSELLDILGRAHAGGHFHWDLTPSNILLAPGLDGSEHASVIGFGIQQIIRATFDPDKTGPTGRGSGPKAKSYLAPELKDARHPDARADVYGVAAVLHHMLTGSPPGPGSTSPPADIAPALTQAMAEDPNARPADAATFGFTLAEGASGGGHVESSFAPPAASMPSAPFAVPAPPQPEAPSAPEASAPKEVSEEVIPDATVVDAPVLNEHEITAPGLLSAADAPGPVAAPTPPAPPAPPAPPPAAIAEPSAGDYESLGPASTAAAADASDNLDAFLGQAPAPAPTPAAPAAPAPSPQEAQAQAPERSSSAVDPFAPAARAPAGSMTKSPFEDDDFAQQEKKRGSMIAAIIVLAIGIGLVVTFFVIRASG